MCFCVEARDVDVRGVMRAELRCSGACTELCEDFSPRVIACINSQYLYGCAVRVFASLHGSALEIRRNEGGGGMMMMMMMTEI
jgi:hypothetical protein